jgi:FdhE protein
MSTTTHQPTWDARIARARELASSRPTARDLLTFYAALAEHQRALTASTGNAGPFDIERVVEAIPGFLSWLRQVGRSELAASVDIDCVASALRARHTAEVHLSAVLSAEARSAEVEARSAKAEAPSPEPRAPAEVEHQAAVFVIESLLQPFADRLVNDISPPPTADSPAMHCPRCGALPVVAVLREEGHGARRFLLCSICLHEWECLRIVCPACGEQEFDKLPVYTAEQFPHVRVDACDTCHHYIKAIDLTVNGLAVPCADDIATVALDLWARERGYTRIKRNVLGF